MSSLNCWVHGQDVCRTFIVEIESTEQVDTLRKEIRKTCALGDTLHVFVPGGAPIPDAPVLEEARAAYRKGMPVQGTTRLNQNHQIFKSMPLPEHIVEDPGALRWPS